MPSIAYPCILVVYSFIFLPGTYGVTLCTGLLSSLQYVFKFYVYSNYYPFASTFPLHSLAVCRPGNMAEASHILGTSSQVLILFLYKFPCNFSMVHDFSSFAASLR